MSDKTVFTDDQISKLAKDLGYQLVYYGTLSFEDLNEQQKIEYNEWSKEYSKNNF